MEPARFDHLTRSLFVALTRRQALASTLAGFSTLLGSVERSAGHGHHRHGRNDKNKRKKRCSDPPKTQACGETCCDPVKGPCCKGNICCEDFLRCCGGEQCCTACDPNNPSDCCPQSRVCHGHNQLCCPATYSCCNVGANDGCCPPGSSQCGTCSTGKCGCCGEGLECCGNNCCPFGCCASDPRKCKYANGDCYDRSPVFCSASP
jgi:hypothetical protein